MAKLRNGIVQALTGILLGIALTTVVGALVKNGTLPGYSIWLLGVVNIILNLATINSFRYAGTLYAVGWLVGSLILKDAMSPVGIAINIACPLLIIIARVLLWIKNPSSKGRGPWGRVLRPKRRKGTSFF